MNRIKIALVFVSYSSSLLFSEPNTNTWYKTAQSAKKSRIKENIFLDNTFVQRYNSQLGLWHYVRSVIQLRDLARKYKTTEKLVRKVNSLKIRSKTSGWIFMPFSESFYKDYIKRGILRRKLVIPQADFLWPIEGSRITSRVGKRWGINHRGLDIAASSRTIVLAVQSGKVIKRSYSRGYGKVVFLEHGEGYITKYAHLSVILVKEDDVVEKGQVIALSGNSGRSTGPHLHFEVECGGILLDPEDFLPEFDYSMESLYNYRAGLLKRLEIEDQNK